MPKNDMKSKSTRKPLRDVSNGAACKHSNKPAKKKSLNTDEDRVAGGGDAVDRLLLVHSDLSALVHQIDELVVQAVKLKVENKKGRKEIESFAYVLSEMQNSLKPWIPRFQKAVSNGSPGSENQLEVSVASKTFHSVNEDTSQAPDSPDQTNLDSLVSPSPLVSWRADCTTKGDRQLFRLTPLPRPRAFSSKIQGSSKSVFEKIADATVRRPSHFSVSGDANDDMIGSVDFKATPCKLSNPFATSVRSTFECVSVSPEKFPNRNFHMVVSTPRFKMSPPKSCILLEPISEYSHKNNHGARKSTPFPVGGAPQDSGSSSCQASDLLTLIYPELFGIKAVHKLGNGKKVVEESPNWFISPPKTCILLEPPNEESLVKENDAVIKDTETNLSLKENENQDGLHKEVIEGTPMWKYLDNTIVRGKLPGENTLKKELWTRFEAATTHGIRFNTSVVQETVTASKNKGFLDLLEEVSSDETNTISDGLIL